VPARALGELGRVLSNAEQVTLRLGHDQASFEVASVRVTTRLIEGEFPNYRQLIPQSHPFVYHKYVVYVLVRPVPRVFWPEKPIDPGFDLPTALGVEGVSYSYSVIGELYMSLGLLGVALGGWFYGRVAAMASGLLKQTTTQGAFVIYSIVVMALFSGMRSILELILVSYVVLAWVGLSQLFIKLRRARSV